MIAQPLPPSSSPTVSADESLSLRDLHQLTLYKWRYTFESQGFKPYQVEQLIFLTWLHATGKLRP